MRLIPLALSLALLTTPALAQTSDSLLSFDDARNVFTMAPIISRVSPGVVSINTVEREEADGSTLGGIGSGVILDAARGHVLTNDHVIEGSTSITVVLHNRMRYTAQVLGRDTATDLALLQIDAPNLQSVPVAIDDDVEVGDVVIAVGNPFGLSQSVSTGIVSALGRRSDDPLGYTDLIQTDASINPGNSGGALVNSAGELIGINSAIVSRERGSSGIGFAIPAHTFVAVAEQLDSYGEVTRGTLGVMITPLTQDRLDGLGLTSLDGALIVEVVSGGAAASAGLRIDDVVTVFDGREIGHSSDLRYAVGNVRPGTTVDLLYYRDGALQAQSVVIQPTPFERQAAVEYEVILDPTTLGN